MDFKSIGLADDDSLRSYIAGVEAQSEQNSDDARKLVGEIRSACISESVFLDGAP